MSSVHIASTGVVLGKNRILNMSITETVVKILTTALTARVAFRLVLVIVSVVTTLHYLVPVFSKLISSPSSDVLDGGIITLLAVLSGVALGTLLFELSNKVYSSINNFLKLKKKRKAVLLVQEQETADRLAQKKIFIKNFVETYSHLDTRLKYILKDLLTNNTKLNLDSDNIRFLKRKEWIILINTLPKNIGVFKIHNLIGEELKKIIEKTMTQDVNNLIGSELLGCKEILSVFSNPNYSLEKHEVKEADYFESHPIISHCFYLNVHRDSLHIKWREGYKSIYESLAKTEVRDFCEITLTEQAFSVGLNSSFKV